VRVLRGKFVSQVDLNQEQNGKKPPLTLSKTPSDFEGKESNTSGFIETGPSWREGGPGGAKQLRANLRRKKVTDKLVLWIVGVGYQIKVSKEKGKYQRWKFWIANEKRRGVRGGQTFEEGKISELYPVELLWDVVKERVLGPKKKAEV